MFMAVAHDRDNPDAIAAAEAESQRRLWFPHPDGHKQQTNFTKIVDRRPSKYAIPEELLYCHIDTAATTEAAQGGDGVAALQKGLPLLCQDKYCASCYKTNTSETKTRDLSNRALLKCTACKAVFYCGRECQKNDWENHRQECRGIKKARSKLQSELDSFTEIAPMVLDHLVSSGTIQLSERQLQIQEERMQRQFRPGRCGPVLTTDAAFESFYGHQSARLEPCMHSVFDVIEKLESSVARTRLECVREEILELVVNLKRNTHNSVPDITGTSIDQTLIKLYRDDDAVAYMWYLVKTHHQDPEHVTDHEYLMAPKPGDWPFPTHTPQGVRLNRFTDILDETMIPSRELEMFLWRYGPEIFMDLLLVKMRVLTVHRIQTEKLESFVSTSAAKSLPPDLVRTKLAPFFVELHSDMGAAMQQQTTRLLAILQVRNPTMLPTLLHPEPVLKRSQEEKDAEKEQGIVEGQPPEAYVLAEHFYTAYGEERMVVQTMKRMVQEYLDLVGGASS